MIYATKCPGIHHADILDRVSREAGTLGDESASLRGNRQEGNPLTVDDVRGSLELMRDYYKGLGPVLKRACRAYGVRFP